MNVRDLHARLACMIRAGHGDDAVYLRLFNDDSTSAADEGVGWLLGEADHIQDDVDPAGGFVTLRGYPEVAP